MQSATDYSGTFINKKSPVYTEDSLFILLLNDPGIAAMP
jgi:hypothetical protein